MSSSTSTLTRGLTAAQAHEIAVEAYVFLYSIVTMEITRRQLTNVESLNQVPFHGPMNTFVHVPAFPPAEFKGVVRPNFDTLYSSAWLDLSAEPLIVSVPDTRDRYYLLPMLDMWSDVFAVPGKRTTGTGAGDFAVVGPHWSGQLPAGVTRIDAPTSCVWIIGRVQTNGTQDYEAVHTVQAGLSIVPLSQWKGETKSVQGKVDPTVDMKTPPLDQVNNMDAVAYFNLGAELMKLNPPHVTDQAMMARMQRIGLEPGKAFVPSEDLDPKRAAADGLERMRAKLPTMARVVDGWQMNTDTMGVYGNYYVKRAVVAMVGLGANQPEDAVYPMCPVDSEGRALDGSHRYVLHFEKDALPPVDAFWSATMYDNDGFQVVNPLNRFAIGDRDALQYNADGSLDLYIQVASPGTDRESNWLPAPPTPFNVTMRLYAPHASVLTGGWSPPPIKRVD